MNSKHLESTQSSLSPIPSVYCQSPKEILTALKRLYLHYSAKSNKFLSSLLTNVSLVKLLQDSKVIDNRLKKREIEIIVSREAGRNNSISFEMFCEILARLAKQKYRQEYTEISPTDALFCLISSHLYPLYLQLEQNQNISHFENIDQNIDQNCIQVLNSCISVLNVLYEKYFQCEMSCSLKYAEILKNSEQAMILFLHKFDITPTCVNYKIASNVWQDIIVIDTFPDILHHIKGKDLGKVFTFMKFVLFLTRCAFLSIFPRGNSLSSAQKVTSLLGRIEHSTGFKEIEKEYMRIHNYRLKLIPLHNQSEILYTITNYEIKETSIHNLRDSISSDSSLSISFEAYSKIDPHIDTLEYIFRAYCNYGDRDYAQKLSLNKYLKLLLDALIVQSTAAVLPIDADGHEQSHQPVLYKLPRAEAELIFAQVAGKRRKINVDGTRSSHMMNKEMDSKIDFNQFMKTLEMISSRVFVDCSADSGLPYMIENYILKLNIGSTNNSLDQLISELEILRKDEHQEVMNALSCTVSHYVKIYQDSQGLMNFEEFSRFLRDFEMFPTIVSKSKSVNIYYILSREFKKSKGITSSNIISTAHTITMLAEFYKDLIDFSLFVEGIGLCAMNLNIQHYDTEAKIVNIIQRIIYSKGAAIVSVQTGFTRNNLWENDIVVKFIRSQNSIKTPKSDSFFDMIKEKPKKADSFCR